MLGYFRKYFFIIFILGGGGGGLIKVNSISLKRKNSNT